MKKNKYVDIQTDSQIKFIYAALATYIVLFSLVVLRDYSIHNYTDMYLELIFTIISLGTFLYFHYTKNLSVSMVLVVWIAYGLILALLVTNKLEHYVVMYIVIVPLVPFFIFNLSRALWHIFIFYLLLVMVLYSMDWEGSHFLQDTDAIFNLMINVLFIFALGFIYHLSIKRTYLRLEESYHQNHILLQEVHHRVKNNLQLILSMIRLQRRRSKFPEVINELSNIESRINAIAKIYDKLLTGTEPGTVDSTQYIELLVRDIQESLGTQNNDIRFLTDIRTKIPLEKSVYVGLMINELVTNALKYAFPQKKGKVHIALFSDKNDIVLEVKDDGKGFAYEEKSDSLGLKLIDTLVRHQLHGVLLFSARQGSCFTIRFPA